MSVRTPHFLLYSRSDRSGVRGDWQFTLQSSDGRQQFEVRDEEPAMQGERLELLAVVRGLEALEQPSHVTLHTASGYVKRGIAYGLDEWRSNGWQWERHGEMVPVKNHDLWQRIDRALRFHTIQCRSWRLDDAHATDTFVMEDQPREAQEAHIRSRPRRSLLAAMTGRLRAALSGWGLRLARCEAMLAPQAGLQ